MGKFNKTVFKAFQPKVLKGLQMEFIDPEIYEHFTEAKSRYMEKSKYEEAPEHFSLEYVYAQAYYRLINHDACVYAAYDPTNYQDEMGVQKFLVELLKGTLLDLSKGEFSQDLVETIMIKHLANESFAAWDENEPTEIQFGSIRKQVSQFMRVLDISNQPKGMSAFIEIWDSEQLQACLKCIVDQEGLNDPQLAKFVASVLKTLPEYIPPLNSENLSEVDKEAFELMFDPYGAIQWAIQSGQVADYFDRHEEKIEQAMSTFEESDLVALLEIATPLLDTDMEQEDTEVLKGFVSKLRLKVEPYAELFEVLDNPRSDMAEYIEMHEQEVKDALVTLDAALLEYLHGSVDIRMMSQDCSVAEKAALRSFLNNINVQVRSKSPTPSDEEPAMRRSSDTCSEAVRRYQDTVRRNSGVDLAVSAC